MKRKLIIIFMILFLVEDLILAYDNLQKNKLILGIKLANSNSFELQKPIKLAFSSQKFLVYPNDLGVKIVNEPSNTELLSYGRRGSIFQRLLEQNAAILGFYNQRQKVMFSPGLTGAKILQISNKVEKNAAPPMPDFINDITKTIPAHEGIAIDNQKLLKIFEENILHPPEFSIDIPTKKIATKSNFDQKEIDRIRNQAIDLTQNSLSISSGGLVLTLSPTDLLSMLTVVTKPSTTQNGIENLSLRIDTPKLNSRLDKFASDVEKITNAEFSYQDARAAIYGLFYLKDRRTITIATGTRFNATKVLGSSTSSGHKILYLTFDDGPDPIHHPLVLDILKNYDVPATFFLIGKNAQKYPDLVAKTLDNGNIIGNHSFTHPFLPNLSNSSILEELSETANLLKGLNGNRNITLFRPPFGGTNGYVYVDANKLGEKLYLWDVDPRDWSEPETSDLINRVVSKVHDGAIILMHSNHQSTVRALPQILQILKSSGYEFKTLTQ